MKKFLGIDIGTYQTKLVEIEQAKDGNVVENASVILGSPNAILSDAVIDQDAVAEHIIKALHDSGIKTRTAVVSLHESRVFTHILEMPLLSEKELVQALQWEAERYIPLPLEEVTMDFAVLEKENEHGKMSVAIVASPIRLVDRYIALFHNAGITINSLENEAFAYLRLFQDANNNRLIVDIGDTKTGIYVLRKETIILIRTIPTGSGALTKTLTSEMGISHDQAEQYKRTYGIDPLQMNGSLVTYLAPVLNSIISEINQSMTYFKEKYPNEVVLEVLLAGGGGRMPGLAEYIKQQVQVPVGLANPWFGTHISKPVTDHLLAEAPTLCVATGLALRNIT